MTPYRKDVLMWASSGFIGYVQWSVCLIWSQPAVLPSEGIADGTARGCNSLQNKGMALDIERASKHGAVSE